MAGKESVRLNKGIIFVPVYLIGGIFLAFISVFISKGLGDYNTYKSHSWIETEAHFVSSEAYQKLVRRRKHTGTTRYHTVPVTRYRWQYCYEVNGGQYFYITDNHTGSEPERQNRGIMVAEDDPNLYLQYANEGTLKVMLVFGFVIVILGGLVVVGLIFVCKKLQKKIS